MKDLDFEALELRFGGETFRRGNRYFEESRVGDVHWNTRTSTLSASVRGQRATPYSTTVALATQQGRVVGLDFGQCNCPVVFNCKHVVAVLLQAGADSRSSARVPTPSRSDGHWSQALAPIRNDDARRITTSRLRVGLQLAMKLSDERVGTASLFAHPVKLDHKDTWATTGISWSSLPFSNDRRIDRQLDILRELKGLCDVRAHGRAAFSFHRVDSSSIDLADVSGRLLWDLLGEARDRGLPLIHADRARGRISWPSDGEFSVDIKAEETGALSLDGLVVVDGVVVPADRRRFLGADGTGIVYWDDVDDPTYAFRLAALEKTVPDALRRVAASGVPVIVPPADRDDFVLHYLPQLERDCVIVSSDASYTAPVISGPELHLVVEHTGDGRLTVGAHWRYYMDDVEIDYAADTVNTATGLRDDASESGLLSTVLPILGRAPVRAGLFQPFAVADTEAALFVVDRLPRLDQYDNVHISIVGELPDFQDVSDDVGISLSTSALSENNDWFDLGIVVRVDGTDVEFAVVLTAIVRGASHLLFPDGRFFALDRPSLTKLRALVHEARSLQDNPEGPLRISRYQASLWEELTEIGEVARQATVWREQVTALLKLDSVAPQDPPVTLDAVLRPYQLDGYSWLLFLWTHGLGGILADDMGLGKTVQTLAMICKVKENTSLASPFVIVAPTSVVHNWVREAQRFAPALTVVAAAETRAKRRTSIAELAAGADIVVTSYTVFRLDFDDFDSVTWSGLVLDEAQYVKNHKSKTYHCARRLTAPFTLAITGTPIENNLMELWALLSITAPGLFPSPSTFIEQYRTPIEKDGDTKTLTTLRRRIKPLVLRRTKDTVVQDLPPKQEQTVEVELHPRHRKVYETRLARERQKILGLLDDFERNRVMILRSLTILRQLSLDASLVDDNHTDIPSAKLDELVTQLREVIEGGHRALVFSQFTGFLRRVRNRLDAEGIDLVYLDGSTRNRGEVVDRFRSGDAPVFLISLKAGGVGLTLTEADYCFVLDPWWNPATEAQAVDRVHRIGQQRTVFVNRYVARGTIEEKVMALKERKAKLFSSVMDDGADFSGGLTADDIKGLLE
ncbi:SWIM zinc finger [Rhodococcoides kyotonense]|uniref:SWIM zinc finger n=2 Tax=Rhodococcoides kyotonense TaxID=398843 RepID=A0A239IX50_9NOCA|nr:SWIM zinc finger [Rhodococcus kyotonensis]